MLSAALWAREERPRRSDARGRRRRRAGACPKSPFRRRLWLCRPSRWARWSRRGGRTRGRTPQRPSPPRAHRLARPPRGRQGHAAHKTACAWVRGARARARARARATSSPNSSGRGLMVAMVTSSLRGVRPQPHAPDAPEAATLHQSHSPTGRGCRLRRLRRGCRVSPHPDTGQCQLCARHARRAPRHGATLPSAPSPRSGAARPRLLRRVSAHLRGVYGHTHPTGLLIERASGRQVLELAAAKGADSTAKSK